MISRELLLDLILAVHVSLAVGNVVSVGNETLPILARSNRAKQSRYLVFNERPQSFFDAWQTCLSYGLRLATITSPENTVEVQQALRMASVPVDARFWIAGLDFGRGGNFVWITTNKPVWFPSGYRNWYPGQPDNSGGNEHCMELWNTAGLPWNDLNCDRQIGFICQRDELFCDC